MEWSTILSHFLYIHAKKPASLYVGNIIFIFIETITTNFNIFYGIIANQGANTMITPKTIIICLPNDTIFGAFHPKKLASLSIMSAVTYRTTPNAHTGFASINPIPGGGGASETPLQVAPISPLNTRSYQTETF